ncbi:hypothetical protein LOTGIDRAFT_176732, partial [Lottia gigantea]
MMVNANLMLMVVLLWVGALSVASPKLHRNKWGIDCDKYILPINAIWTPRASCEDNKRFRCQIGYVSQIQTICKKGEWSMEPTCQAVECPQGMNITNSDKVTESGIYGGEFSFNCSVGYTKNGGTGTLKCGE